MGRTMVSSKNPKGHENHLRNLAGRPDLLASLLQNTKYALCYCDIFCGGSGGEGILGRNTQSAQTCPKYIYKAILRLYRTDWDLAEFVGRLHIHSEK